MIAEVPNALAQYLSEIGRIPVLTKEQETALVIRLRDGDSEAKQMLIRSNLRLVVAIAKRFMSSGIDLADLIQEGNIGLIEAASDFVTKYGYSFKSYADDAVRHQIIDAIRLRPKLATVSLSLELGTSIDSGEFISLDEVIKDNNATDPQIAAEVSESNDEVALILKLVPHTEALAKVINGYTPHELDSSAHQQYNRALRALAHPSKTSQLQT